MSEELCELGIVGLTSLGQSIAAHHASVKTRVCVGDEDASFVPQVIKEYKTQSEAGEEDYEPGQKRASRCMLPSRNMEEMVARLTQPRKIIIFGTHGEDQKYEEMYWDKLSPILDEGDMVLRWGKEEEGNENNIQFFNDSIVGNLSKLQASPRGIHLLEMVRLERDRMVAFTTDAPDSFLVGGSAEGYKQFEPYISPFAITGHVGSEAGCAHYAHMIQRAIENGMAQAFAEGSDVLRKAAGFENQDIGRTMNRWSEGGGILSSYLLRISSRIFYKRDNITKKGFVVDNIVDSVELNAVDTWVTLEATKLGIPAPTVNATLESRFLSAMKDERVEASSILKVHEGADTPSVLKDQICEDLQNAIYCACMLIVAECLAIFQAACDVESWDANIGELIKFWNQPGSFLESNLLEKVHSTLVNNTEEMKNLLTFPSIASELHELHMSWRRIVSLSVASAIPCPTFSSSLTHYDSYRQRKMPIGLIRAHRDFFDASGYDRIGEGGWFTTCWLKEHTFQMRKKEAALEEVEEIPEPPKKKRKKSRKSTESKSPPSTSTDGDLAAV